MSRYWFILVGIGVGYAASLQVPHHHTYYTLTSSHMEWQTIQQTPACIGSLILTLVDAEFKPHGVQINCDGQTIVYGPRDAAAQAFWDRVIEMTPNRYLVPKRTALQLNLP